jgi:hypothetical protein
MGSIENEEAERRREETSKEYSARRNRYPRKAISMAATFPEIAHAAENLSVRGESANLKVSQDSTECRWLRQSLKAATWECDSAASTWMSSELASPGKTQAGSL